jgi:hypothetical protein
MMSETPICPFCEHRFEDPISESIEGSIKLRCPSCEQRYDYNPQTGSIPLEDDFGIEVSKGLLGPHVVTDRPQDEMSLMRALLIGSLCCCTLVVIIPVVMALILAYFG